MPKATWGAGDNALTADDIDGAERAETRKRYSGPTPRSGTYRFVIQSLKKGESGNGNPKLVVFATIDGTWMANHKQYDGAPLWDHLPVMPSTKERVANFCDAIGATSKDFLSGMIVDENGYVTKLGKVGDPKGLMVYINVKKQAADGPYDESLKVDFNGYIPVDDAEEDDAGTTEGTEEEPPF
jgi:hypothetical protein